MLSSKKKQHMAMRTMTNTTSFGNKQIPHSSLPSSSSSLSSSSSSSLSSSLLSYHEQVEEGLSRALLQLDPFHDNDAVFYPHVELGGTALDPIEVEQIDDTQNIYQHNHPSPSYSHSATCTIANKINTTHPSNTNSFGTTATATTAIATRYPYHSTAKNSSNTIPNTIGTINRNKNILSGNNYGKNKINATISMFEKTKTTNKKEKVTTPTPTMMMNKKKKKKESCLIESTKNSVRISFLFKQQQQQQQQQQQKQPTHTNGNNSDGPLDASILYQWMRCLQQQADDSYQLLRKQPVQGYSISFLITNQHIHLHSTCTSRTSRKKNNTNTNNNNNNNNNGNTSNSDNEKVYKQEVLRMIVHFCSQMDKECRDIKLDVNAEARYITTKFLEAFRV